MWHIDDFQGLDLQAARPLRLNRPLVAHLVTGAIGLLAAGVLFGAYAAAVARF